MTLSDANDLAGEPAVETGASAEAVTVDQPSSTEPLGPFGRHSLADRSECSLTPSVSRWHSRGPSFPASSPLPSFKHFVMLRFGPLGAWQNVLAVG